MGRIEVKVKRLTNTVQKAVSNIAKTGLLRFV